MDTNMYENYKTLNDLPVVTIERKPESKNVIKGVIQILHGMCEHKERYNKMLDFFTSHGYICVIPDMRGHGENVSFYKDYGYFGERGEKLLVEDTYAVNAYIHNNYPDLPVIMFGHSMGSIVARSFVKKYGNQIDMLFLSGAPADSIGKYFGVILTEILLVIFEEKDNSKLLDKLFYRTMKKRFKSEGRNAWLCSNKEVVAKYNDDEKCNFTFTLNGYSTLFRLMVDIYSKKKWKNVTPSNRIYFIAGQDDVCIKNEEHLKAEVDTMKAVGYTKTKYKIFDGMRHEIHNETNREVVWEYMLEKMENI